MDERFNTLDYSKFLENINLSDYYYDLMAIDPQDINATFGLV